jgi:hypothetical protein
MRASIVKLVFIISEKYIPFSHAKVNTLFMFKNINNAKSLMPDDQIGLSYSLTLMLLILHEWWILVVC